MPTSFEQAASLYRQGDTSGAAERRRAILRDQPENAPALNLLGVLIVGEGEAEAGLELIRSAVSLEPTNPEFLVNLGHALTAADQLTEAVETLTEATRVPGSPSQAFLALARVCRAWATRAACWRCSSRLCETLAGGRLNPPGGPRVRCGRGENERLAAARGGHPGMTDNAQTCSACPKRAMASEMTWRRPSPSVIHLPHRQGGHKERPTADAGFGTVFKVLDLR